MVTVGHFCASTDQEDCELSRLYRSNPYFWLAASSKRSRENSETRANSDEKDSLTAQSFPLSFRWHHFERGVQSLAFAP